MTKCKHNYVREEYIEASKRYNVLICTECEDVLIELKDGTTQTPREYFDYMRMYAYDDDRAVWVVSNDKYPTIEDALSMLMEKEGFQGFPESRGEFKGYESVYCDSDNAGFGWYNNEYGEDQLGWHQGDDGRGAPKNPFPVWLIYMEE